MNLTKSCAFWNIEEEGWDKDGCTLLDENTTLDVVTCSCSHLTNFALIMGDGSCEDSSKFSEFEDYLSQVLGGISIVLLLITQFCKQVIRLVRNAFLNLKSNIAVLRVTNYRLLICKLDSEKSISCLFFSDLRTRYVIL